MTAGSNSIKNTAKTALKGNYTSAIISGLILVFCALINIYVSSLTEIFAGSIFSEISYLLMSVFLFFPLSMGVLRFFWRMILGCDDNPVSVFYYFSAKTLYFKAMKFFFAIAIKLIPIAIILFLPVLFVWLLSQSYFYEFLNMPIPLWSGNLSYAILFARTLATVILVMFALRYYAAPMLFVADEEIDAAEALHMSSVISKKTMLDFIYLIFSFAGWIILSVFAIPLFYTLPYLITSYAVHIRFIITEYNQHIENTAEQQYPSFSVGA